MKRIFSTGLMIFFAMIAINITSIMAPLSPHVSAAAAATPAPAASCDRSGRLFGLFPKWYAYIKEYQAIPADGTQFSKASCGILGGEVTDHVVAIGLAAIDGILRLAGVIAVAFVIYGGIRYIISQGEPENIKSALQTIISALVGLVIVLLSSAVVVFIGNSLG